MSNSKRNKAVATTAAVAVQGHAMSTMEREIADTDAGLFLSSAQTRKDLMACFIEAGRTSADWTKPEGDACSLFYNSLRSVSRTACESGMAKLGLTDAELVQFPDGYSIATVIDSEVKPSQLPDWATESNRHNGLSIRRYWQQQTTAWFKSTLKSMEKEEAKANLIKGGANALGKVKAQLTVDNLGSALKRDCDMPDDAVLVMGVTFAATLRDEILRIVADTDATLPKFMVEAK
jgi:hypothetical protein